MDRALALLEPFGTLERPLAKGPRFGALGTPARLLRPLYCSLAGRDSSLYYLRCKVTNYTIHRSYG